MDDLFADFLADTRVELDRAQDALARLERGAPAAGSLDELRRGVSAIRARCATAGYVRIAALATGAESLLARLRIADAVSPAETRVIRRAVDRMARLLATLAATGDEPRGGDHDIARALTDDVDALREKARAAARALAPAPAHDIWLEVETAFYEICRPLGKTVTLTIDPSARALSLGALTGLSGALQRLIRYCLAYSIEPDLVRRARGKSGDGAIRISALRIGDGLVIALSDDGAGLDLARVRARAGQLNLISPREAAALSDARACELLFAPRLSTLGEPTPESGLDRAKAAIEALGGGVEATTLAGRGLTFLVRVPSAPHQGAAA